MLVPGDLRDESQAPGTLDPRVALAAEGIRLAPSDVAKLAAPEGAGV